MKVKMGVLAVVLGLSSLAIAGDMDVQSELAALKAQMQAQQARIAQQDAQIAQMKGENWLNARRAEEVKALIADVLADADTRASLLQSGMSAGYQDGFFLASADGNFRMNVVGQMQIRYTLNTSDQAPVTVPGTDRAESNEGFTLPRIKLGFYGHLFDPTITYGLSGRFDTNGLQQGQFGTNDPFGEDGDFELEDAWVGYEFAEGWKVRGGQFQGQFTREEAVHSGKLLAVERSMVNQLYTLDYVQGVEVTYAGEIAGQQIRAAGTFHDGSYSANLNDFWVRPLVGAPVALVPGGDLYDFGIGGRGEWLVMGAWEDLDDQQAWSSGNRSLMIGAAFNIDEAAGGNGNTIPDVVKWTVDATLELPDLMGLSVFFAYVGMDTAEKDTTFQMAVRDPQGIVAQVGAFVVPDKIDAFIRYEYIDWDVNPAIAAATAADEYSTLTFGGNYYMKGNNAKASLDVIYAMRSTNLFNGAGMIGSGQLPGQNLVISQGDQVAVRGQLQLMF